MTADPVGGVWRHVMELSRGLCLRGCEVYLVTFGALLSPSQWDEAKKIVGLQVSESLLRLEWMDDPWDDIDRAGDLLEDHAARIRPDIIHLNGYALAFRPWGAPVIVGAHSCVISWWHAVKGEIAPARFDTYRARVGRGLASASMVVTPTNGMLDMLRACYDEDFSGCVIPNGLDLEGYFSGPKCPRILACGRIWDEAKNIRLLDDVAPSVGWEIAVAGPAALDRAGFQLKNATPLGTLSAAEMAKTFGRAPIYAAPALYEPFGLAVLEAALSESALVLADIPTFRELWSDVALFVDPRDPEAWQQALSRCIQYPEFRATMAARARSRARRFSANAMVQGYYSLYQALSASRRATTLAPLAA